MPYNPAHRDGVVDLWRRVFADNPSWNEPGRDADRKSRLQGELFLVAVQAGRVVGTVMGGYDGHRGWIYYLAVDAGHRRQGIGFALMASVERGLAELGCPKINLQVRANNPGVVGFYRKLGYQVEERVSLGKLL